MTVCLPSQPVSLSAACLLHKSRDQYLPRLHRVTRGAHTLGTSMLCLLGCGSRGCISLLSPCFSLHLHGSTWWPVGELSQAQEECRKVGELCGVMAVLGEAATRERFVADCREATLIHIGKLTYFCFSKKISKPILVVTLLWIFFKILYSSE